MCFYIGIEDLAANALIELLQKEENRSFITYKELERYGTQVVRLLSERGEKAVLLLSRENTNAMFRDYSEFFEEDSYDGNEGIRLRAGKSRKDLIVQFRGYLALDVLMALVDERSVSALGVQYLKKYKRLKDPIYGYIQIPMTYQRTRYVGKFML